MYKVLIFSAALFGLNFLDVHPLSAQTFSKMTIGANAYGAAWSDYNNDGFMDVFLDKLYRNNGDETFTAIDDTNTAGDIPLIDPGSWSHSASWGDFDNDGDDDLFVIGSNDEVANELFLNNGDGTFTSQSAGIAGDIVSVKSGSASCGWGDYDNDGFLDMFVSSLGGENILYRNNGAGAFEQILTAPFTEYPSVSSEAFAWGDFNNDNDPDIFAPNCCNGPNFLFYNNGNAAFEEVTTGEILLNNSDAIGCSVGDYDNDMYLDIVVTDYNNSNALYNNNGDGTFTKVEDGSIVNEGGTAGSAWGDMDNDGDLDLAVARTYGGPLLLFENDGDGNFTKVTTGVVAADDNPPTQSFGLTWVDINNDGALDLFGSSLWTVPNTAYINTPGNNHWIKVRLEGNLSNRNGAGAKVKIFADGKWQMREVSATSGITSQSGYIVHFGLAAATTIDILQIEWPSGTLQQLTNVNSNATLNIVEASTGSMIPQFISVPETAATENVLYTYNIQTADMDNAEIVISALSKPDWLEFADHGDKTATLTGTPLKEDVGQDLVVLRVSDGENHREQTFSILVTAEPAVVTGMSETSNGKIDVYPNPFFEKLSIALNQKSGVAELYSVQGRCVATLLLHDGQNEWRIPDLKSGLYLLKVRRHNGTVQTKLIFKK